MTPVDEVFCDSCGNIFYTSGLEATCSGCEPKEEKYNG